MQIARQVFYHVFTFWLCSPSPQLPPLLACSPHASPLWMLQSDVAFVPGRQRVRKNLIPTLPVHSPLPAPAAPKNLLTILPAPQQTSCTRHWQGTAPGQCTASDAAALCNPRVFVWAQSHHGGHAGRGRGAPPSSSHTATTTLVQTTARAALKPTLCAASRGEVGLLLGSC